MKIIKNLGSLNETGQHVVYTPSGLRDWDISANYDSSNNIITLNVLTYKNGNTSYFDAEANTVVTVNTQVVFANVSSTINVSSLMPSFEDHGAFVILQDKDDLESNTAITSHVVTDLFKMSLPSKLNFNDIRKMHNKVPAAVLIVPYANSRPEDLILMVKAPFEYRNVATKFTGFSSQLPDYSSGNWRNDLYPTLNSPALNVATSSTTPLSVQLVDQSGNPIKREGVTIYLDNLGGVLDSNRIVTNADGLATTNLTVGTIATTFKIKAGFKYFSGVLDIPVTVS